VSPSGNKKQNRKPQKAKEHKKEAKNRKPTKERRSKNLRKLNTRQNPKNKNHKTQPFKQQKDTLREIEEKRGTSLILGKFKQRKRKQSCGDPKIVFN
jgi:hypothetical protein